MSLIWHPFDTLTGRNLLCGGEEPATGASAWRAICGSAAVVCALWACGISWAAAATPPSSGCGNCRRDLAAQAALYSEAPGFLAGTVMAWMFAWMLAGRSAEVEVRVARCAAVVALAIWIASIGFVHRWW